MSEEAFLTVAWLDRTSDRTTAQSTFIQLCRSAPYLSAFRDTDRCIDYLTNLHGEDDTKVLLIISTDTFSSIITLLQVCEQLSQVELVYVLCSPTANDKGGLLVYYSIERGGVYTDLSSLCKQLESLPKVQHQRLSVRWDYDLNSSITDLFELPSCESIAATPFLSRMLLPTVPITSKRQEAQFLYASLLREILINLDSSIEEMVDFCREKYADNETELNYIAEFEEWYEADNAVFWYTRDTFLYRMLNKALLDQDIDTLYSMRYFIKDLHLQLQQLHSAAQQSSAVDTVYRGQLMRNKEFEKRIRNNQSGFFSVSGFLSTTLDEDLASRYAGDGSRREKEQSVLFQINIDSTVNKFSYANISSISAFAKTEKETLFSMGAVFRIESLNETQPGLWTVILKLTGEEDNELRQLTDYMRQKILVVSPLNSLAKLLLEMGDYKRAKQFCFRLLEDNTVTGNWKSLAGVHNTLGFIYHQTGDKERAMQHYEKSIQLQPETASTLAAPYSNLGALYDDAGDYNNALTCHKKALHIELSSSAPDETHLAHYYNNIGEAFREEERYEEALPMYEAALALYLKHLPANHPNIATVYNNITVLYFGQRKYDKAVLYGNKTLQLLITSLPENHPELAITHTNLSRALFGQERLKEALKHIRIACKINSLTLSPDHPRTINGQEWLDELEGQLSYSEKDYARAEVFLRRKIKAEAKLLPATHEDLILHRFTLARALYYQEKLDEALEHMKIAYTSRSSTLPADHRSVIQYRKWLEGIEETVKEYAENTDVEKINS